MKLKIALVLLVVAISSHLYLANHYYQLSFGFGDEGASVCNINKTFSCDTVSASQFSEFLGIPIAAWGAATNAVLLVLLMGWIIRWGDNIARLASYATYLAGFTALMSVVMTSISTLFLRTFCVFCITAYVCSFIVFELIRRSRPDDPQDFKENLLALVGPAKSYLILLAAIPIGAFLLNRGILSNYGAKNLSEFVQTAISDWQATPAAIFTAAPALIKGASDADAKMTIVEFADFRCAHCRAASAPLGAFVASRADVQLRFMNFPLDSACNSAVDFGDGISCMLARGVVCAEKLSQKGWDLHDEIFSRQGDFAQVAISDLKGKLSLWGKDHGIDAAAMTTCLEDEGTRKLVADQAVNGQTAGVKGTPTIYVNGKKLPRGQSLHVLEKAYEIAKAK